jgi:hypothetical protein
MCGPCYFADYDKKRNRRKDPADYAPNYQQPPRRRKRPADCHPDRWNVGFGRCGPCYQQQKRDGTLPSTSMATCHPDRPMLAKGQCHACYSGAKYWKDLEGARAAARRTQAETRKRCRDQLVAAYGGRCACANCPETNSAFLTLDHINGDGKAHRMKIGSHAYADLRRRGFPQEGYRLLCWNCNAMTRGGKPCPHEEGT